MKNSNLLEIYIHIPFCEKKCNYCDFCSFISDDWTINEYMNVLNKEIIYKSFIANDKEITSIYIGGGTPSFIPTNHIYNILNNLYNHYNISKNCEISIELNPHSAITFKLKDYYNFGINRLSFGVQSANDNELKFLGRLHNFYDFLKCYDDCIHIGFKNINVDIMKGIPLQNSESYKNTLKQIMKLNLKHLSIYDLIIEEGTYFYSLYKQNKLFLPTDTELEFIDNITKELTEYYHYNRYEISNYAKDGYYCIHNLGYWSDINYIGFGLNSASYIENIRLKNPTKISKYLNINFENYGESVDINDNKKYYDEITELTINDLMSEFIFLGMRKINGIKAKDFYDKFDKRIEDVYKIPLEKYLSLGLIFYNDGRYYLSDRGLDISNDIFADFLL